VKVKLWMETTFVASCAATEATANIAPMIGPISIGTMTERLMANRAVAVQKLVIRVRMSDPSSIGWCLVDDRERLVTHFPAA
jgi:hypothetical protein